MILAFSRITVADGVQRPVRDAFIRRSRLVEEAPGFIGMEVFADSEDESLVYLLTRWTDVEAFRLWHGSETSKLDPACTLVRTAASISPEGNTGYGCVPAGAGLMSRFIAQSQVVCWFRISSSGMVVAHNGAVETALGRYGDGVTGASLWTLVTDADGATLRRILKRGQDQRIGNQLINFIHADGSLRTLRSQIEVQQDGMLILGEPVIEDETALRDGLLALNNQLTVLVRENERQKKALKATARQLEETTKELQGSYWQIRKLQEVLPICMRCGKVKTEKSTWQNVVEFLKEHSLFLSHGYCPPCGAKLMADLATREEASARHEP